MTTRGIRGAITLEVDEAEELLASTKELLTAIISANPGLKTEDIGSVIFTVTDDITSAFPARAARQMDWDLVPMICTREIPVPGSLKLCLRVLIHWNTDTPQSEIQHVYLHNAVQLRPDLSTNSRNSDKDGSL